MYTVAPIHLGPIHLAPFAADPLPMTSPPLAWAVSQKTLDLSRCSLLSLVDRLSLASFDQPYSNVLRIETTIKTVMISGYIS
jgi:hypothetical protein